MTAAVCQRAHHVDCAHRAITLEPCRLAPSAQRAGTRLGPTTVVAWCRAAGENTPVLEIRPSVAWRRALVTWGAVWGAGMLALAIVFLVSGRAITAVGTLLLGAVGVILNLRGARVAVSVDATGMSVTNIDGFDRVPRSEIKAFRSRWLGPHASVVVVVRDGPFCRLDATVRVNPFRAGRIRAEQQLQDLRHWLDAESDDQVA